MNLEEFQKSKWFRIILYIIVLFMIGRTISAAWAGDVGATIFRGFCVILFIALDFYYKKKIK